MNRIYVLRHDVPEIKAGAILEYSNSRGRYVVVNLSEVARYPLTLSSSFTFHKDVVENKSHWFELVDDCNCDCHN